MTDILDEWGGDVATLLHAARWGFDYEAIVYRLHHDVQFALEMRVCKEWKIPHSEFLSWDEQDQQKALAHFVYEAQRCSGCGIHPDDWPDQMVPMFEAISEVCPGCAELDRYQRFIKERTEGQPPSTMDGMKTHLKKVER